MMPQFAQASTYRFQVRNFSLGTAFFLIGLFKKVVLADEVQPFVGPVFEHAPGYTLTMLEAWGGAVAYTLQIYFDFSGYSDMAIGLGRMFGFRFPENFRGRTALLCHGSGEIFALGRGGLAKLAHIQPGLLGKSMGRGGRLAVLVRHTQRRTRDLLSEVRLRCGNSGCYHGNTPGGVH
jgi:hypothetical protein